ncbi:MAG: alpha/beta hydrolase [Pseudomonadota bacterium]
MDAPLLDDLGELPAGGSAWYDRTEDGTRLRFARWPEGTRGTVLLLTGRTEYIEKYREVIAAFQKRGYAVVTLDWRGQGLSDRADAVGVLGHVRRFSEFQQDLRMLATAAVDLPKPHVMVAHSMGGCIGLRGLVSGLPVDRAVFSAPMWGLHLSPLLGPVAPFIARFLRAIGRGNSIVPGGTAENYVETMTFPDNTLTNDQDMFERMRRDLKAQPNLGLGAPTVSWLGAAFDEMGDLFEAPSPRLPILVGLGSKEAVVSSSAIMTHAERMPSATVLKVNGAKHELFMEADALQSEFWGAIDRFLEA